jgi:hypothetical protein
MPVVYPDWQIKIMTLRAKLERPGSILHRIAMALRNTVYYVDDDHINKALREPGSETYWSDWRMKLMTLKVKLKAADSFAQKLTIVLKSAARYVMKDDERNRAPKEFDWSKWQKKVQFNYSIGFNVYVRLRRLIRSPVTVVNALDFPETRKTPAEWQKMTLGKVTFVDAPGNHGSIFFPPNVEHLHKALKHLYEGNGSDA